MNYRLETARNGLNRQWFVQFRPLILNMTVFDYEVEYASNGMAYIPVLTAYGYLTMH